MFPGQWRRQDLVPRGPAQNYMKLFAMAALWNRASHYIFALWFLILSIFFLFSSPNLSGRRLDVYYTYTGGVALVRI